jgi:hypothetical protein
MKNDSPETDSSKSLEIECDNCSGFRRLIYPSSHFAYAVKGDLKGMLCSDCAVNTGQQEIPAVMFRPIIENTPLDKPLSGGFRPITTTFEDPDSGAYQHWMHLGHMILEEMAVWKDKIMKFTFGGNRYKGLWLKPEWDGSRIVGISIAGDTPSKKLELDIYQRFRLTQFGFVEGGRSNKTWSIELSEPEGNIPNASSVIIHILRFGYLLEPSDLNSITPTLDVDFSDPGYKRT